MQLGGSIANTMFILAKIGSYVSPTPWIVSRTLAHLPPSNKRLLGDILVWFRRFTVYYT